MGARAQYKPGNTRRTIRARQAGHGWPEDIPFLHSFASPQGENFPRKKRSHLDGHHCRAPSLHHVIIGFRCCLIHLDGRPRRAGTQRKDRSPAKACESSSNYRKLIPDLQSQDPAEPHVLLTLRTETHTPHAPTCPPRNHDRDPAKPH
eukprot:1138768-Pelagomonas_calceolata.AAC.5